MFVLGAAARPVYGEDSHTRSRATPPPPSSRHAESSTRQDVMHGCRDEREIIPVDQVVVKRGFTSSSFEQSHFGVVKAPLYTACLSNHTLVWLRLLYTQLINKMVSNKMVVCLKVPLD